MSVRLPSGGDRRDDDELLDRVGRGEPVYGGDVERMLSSWRASMPAAGPADERLLDAVSAAVARPRRAHRHRKTKVTAGLVATALIVGGGVAAAAAQAGPGSPLWPVTELVFGGLAESRAALDSADDTLRAAKTAAEQGRIPEANRLLAEADELAEKVAEPAAADRLRDDIATVRERLRDVGPGPGPGVDADAGGADAPSRSDATHGPGPGRTSTNDVPSVESPPVEVPSVKTTVDPPTGSSSQDQPPGKKKDPKKGQPPADLPVPTPTQDPTDIVPTTTSTPPDDRSQ